MLPFAEVIGDPIDHSLSPLIHRFWLSQSGARGTYFRQRIVQTELEAYFDRRRDDLDWRGCNVTAPLKVKAAALADRLDVEAEQTGAVNCVYRVGGALVGVNTDIAGVAEAVPAERVIAKKVTLIGTGGAARAALRHLECAGAGEVALLTRSRENANGLITGGSRPHVVVHDHAGCRDAMKGAAALINATPLGMFSGLPMPRDILDALDSMDPAGLVFDMVYSPLDTPLLCAARAARRPTVDGLTMLIGQARHAYALFFGAIPERQTDELLRPLLVAALEGQLA